MSEDLSAFFAKKKSKSKKKGVISLDDVGQQLERKARIQELGEDDTDIISSKERDNDRSERSERVKANQNNEDSEWLDFSEKPTLSDFSFRDFNDHQEEEIEQEKKGANAEAGKTWNIGGKQEEPVNDENIAKAPQKYQPPGGARKAANLDLTSEEMFPSIANAEKIEEKIKAGEKKKAPLAVKPEDQFETKSYRSAGKYEPPRGGDRPRPDEGSYAPRNDVRSDRYEPPRPAREGGYAQRTEGGYTHRNEGSYAPRTEGGYAPRTDRYESSRGTFGAQESPRPDSGTGSRRINEGENESSDATEVSNWRSAPSAPAPPPMRRNENSAPAPAKALETDNWRTETRRAPAQQQSPQHQPPAQQQQPATEAPKRAAYVPPSMRNRT